jgi:hypothetical protein
MLRLDVRLEGRVYETLHAAAEGGRRDPVQLAAAVGDVVRGEPAFGGEAEQIADRPGEWFALERMADPEFWAGQERFRAYLDEHLTESVATITPYLPKVQEERVVPIVVHPVPGFTACYGAVEGGQLYGLYDGADPREMLLFLSHTYYHELSACLDTETSRRAGADPSTAGHFRHWLLLLIRNEGIANYAVLGPLRALRRERISFRYFTYAGLVDNAGATARAMAACRELLGGLDGRTVRRVSGRLSAVLKNPRLPIINLIGIHMAEAIAARYGERALLDVDGCEPQAFFSLYASTGDGLCRHLFGPDGTDATAVFGLEPDAVAAGTA